MEAVSGFIYVGAKVAAGDWGREIKRQVLFGMERKVKPDAIPSHRKGVVSIAPLPMYESPDGDYKDTTKKWD
ncbi:hypothetical protein D918_08583 [Trichuris suis]|nr:hypothetical protein D918_08583 [Trichuris suis]